MNKFILPLVALVALSACTKEKEPSREERIVELIREDLNKKIPDFSDYEALETQIGDSVFVSAKLTLEAYDLAQEIIKKNDKIQGLNQKIESLEELSAGISLPDAYKGELQYYRSKIEEAKAEIDSLKGEIRKIDASVDPVFAGYYVSHRCRYGKTDHKQILDLSYVIDDATGNVFFTHLIDDASREQLKIIDEALSEK